MSLLRGVDQKTESESLLALLRLFERHTQLKRNDVMIFLTKTCFLYESFNLERVSCIESFLYLALEGLRLG